MSELIENALSPVNLPLTVLLAAVMGYWLLCVLGVLDLDFLGGSLDGGDGGIDGGFEGGDAAFDGGDAALAGGGFHHEGGALAEAGATDSSLGGSRGETGLLDGVFKSALRLLNATDVPVMVVLTFLTVFLWGGSMLANYYFNAEGSELRAALLMAPVLVGALLLTRVAAAPLRPVFRRMRSPAGETSFSVIGRSALVRTVELSDSFGQIELLPPGPALLVNARVSEGAAPLSKGTRVLVVDYDSGTEIYRVRTSDEDAIEDDPLPGR